MDGWRSDNGYVFGWELTLDSSLMTLNCAFDSFAVHGEGAVQLDNDRFIIVGPSHMDGHDTSILYRFYAYDTCGRVLDTFALVTFLGTQHEYVKVECVENSLPYVFMDSSFTSSATDCQFELVSAVGCDSIVHFSLTVWWNSRTYIDTVVCDGTFPMEWRGYVFEGSDSVVIRHLDVHGADSNTIYRLWARSPDTTECFANICTGRHYTWVDGRTYYDDSETPCYNVTTDGVCDSVLRLHIIVSVDAYKAKLLVSPNPVSMDDNVVMLNDVSSSVSRVWSFVDKEDTSRVCRFVYPFPTDSVEVFSAGRDGYGCRDSVRIVVYSDFAPIWAPNAFTPDEQTNRRFLIMSYGVKSGTVTIFTRSGNEVAEFDALTGSWDGSFGSTPCPQGSYVWKLSYFTERNSAIERVKVGTVTLLR